MKIKDRIAVNISVLVLLALLPFFAKGQADIHFSQFYETSILRNPALTGVFSDDFKFGAYTRNQWSNISNPYQTQLISGETHKQVSHRSNDFISFGLLAYADEAGSLDQRITAGYLSVAYNKSLSAEHPMFLSVGFTGACMQYSLDYSNASFNTQFVGGSYSASNPNYENLPNPKMQLYDVGAGINFNSTNGENTSYMLGVACYHINQPEYSYYRTPEMDENMRYNVNAGWSADVNPQINITLQGNYAMEGPYTEIIFGSLLNWAAEITDTKRTLVFSAGLLYRVDDAMIPVVKITRKNLSIGVSYDVNVSTLSDASQMRGGYELTVFYTGNYNGSGSDAVRKVMCPKFY